MNLVRFTLIPEAVMILIVLVLVAVLGPGSFFPAGTAVVFAAITWRRYVVAERSRHGL